jgi:hypothetical protein
LSEAPVLAFLEMVVYHFQKVGPEQSRASRVEIVEHPARFINAPELFSVPVAVAGAGRSGVGRTAFPDRSRAFAGRAVGGIQQP